MPQAKDEAGNIWEVDAQGNPVRLISAASQQGNVYSLPSSPQQVAQDQRAAAAAERDQRRLDMAEQSAQMTRRLQELEVAKRQQDLAKGQTGGTQGVKIDPAAVKRANLEALAKQLAEVEAQFNANFAGAGDRGLAEYLPTPTNKAFDAAAAGLSEQALGAFRVPGVGAQSDTELRAFVEANRPSSREYDAVNRQRINNIRIRLDEQLKAMGIAPNAAPAPNAMDQAFVQGGDPTRALAAGSDQAVQQIPEALRQEYAAYVAQNAGRIDPQAYATFRNGLNAKYGFQAAPGTDYTKEAASLNEYYRKGGRTFGNIPNIPKKLSQGEALWNAGANNPVTALTASAIDGTFAGLPGAGLDAMTGGKFGMMQDANPKSAFVGNMIGAVAGAKGLGAIGKSTLGRALPSLLKDGRWAQVGRNLATDATYGSIYGGAKDGDPLGGAVAGGIGSGLGQAVGSGLGRIATGVAENPAAQYLRTQGVNALTVGQRAGGWVKGVEDRLSGLNFIGDQVNARRMEGFRDYNAAEFRNAGQPIGAVPTDIGDRGLQQLSDAKSAAYSQYLDPAQIDTMNDPGLVQDVAQARIAASQIPNVQPTMPRDYAEQSLQNRLDSPVDANGMMSGRAFQEAYRGLARDARSRMNSDYGHEIGQATRLGQDALAGALERQNPGAFAGFQAANLTNRRLSVLADAVNRARNGGRTGEVGVFAPSQFTDAAAANRNKFPGGFDTALAKNAQEIMPNKIPDSGTAGRLALLALPGALGGAGYGADKLGASDNGLGVGLTIGALLAAGGTKGGQKALGNLLFERPKPMRDFGKLVRQNKGLFGSAAVPLAVQLGN